MIKKELENQALKLKTTDKIHLVELLLESLDKPDPEILQTWVKESEKRYEAYKQEKTKSVPYEKVIKRIKSEKN